MRNFSFFLTLVFIQFTIFTHAQRVYKEPEPERGPDVVTPKTPAGEHDPNNEAPGVPGALATGENPNPAPEDEEPDWDDVADALKDLLEKIVDALIDSTSGGSSSSGGGSVAKATISSPAQTALPILASPCANALNAFSTCSSAYNGTFSAVATTVQAGCLCNAAAAFDFNGETQGCHSYALDHTQLRSYATAIANATAVCGCDSAQSSLLGLNLGGCTTSTGSHAAATTSSSSSSSSSPQQAGSGGTVSPSTPSPTGTGGAAGIDCASSGAVAAAVMLGFVSLLL